MDCDAAASQASMLSSKVFERAQEGDIAIGDINLCSFWEGIILGIFPSNVSTL